MTDRMCLRDADQKGAISLLLVMKKDRNRSEQDKPDYSMPREKILRGRRNFQRLFEKSTVLNNQSIQFRYRHYTDPSEGCLIGFVAPKKKIKSAVKRNRVKRLLREAYRLHQGYLQDLFRHNNFGFHAVFMANRDNISYQEVEKDMIPILIQVRKKLIELDNNRLRKGEGDIDNSNNKNPLN